MVRCRSKENRPLPSQVATDEIKRLGFTLGPLLGSGAMSAVYAIERLLPFAAEEALAIKLLHPMHQENVELVLRFFNEQKAAQRVQHPAVIRVLDAGLMSGRPYLLLERCAETLHQRAPTLSQTERITVIAQVASGTLALHRCGVVHRDLKPANVMFSVNDRLAPKIIDLGLSKLITPGTSLPVSTAQSELLGTPEYRAPELWISAKDADASSDVYSLGVMLYELMAGTLPFVADRESRLMDLHLFEPPPALLSTPPVIATFISRMLAKKRSLRPSMAEVFETLRTIAVVR